MRFVSYSQLAVEPGIELEALLAEQKADRMLWARVENSGSEGVYVEVAKWNDRVHQWQRYAFCKFEDAKDKQPAKIVKQINDLMSSVATVIHIMPNYQA